MTDETDLLGGRYRLGPVLGRGGMGVVRRAHDERLDRVVAVKLIHTAGDDASRRLEHEARLLGRLQHPNLVTALDTGVEGRGSNAVVWLAMELVDGPDLGTLLRSGPLEDDDVRRILGDVAAALGAVHAASVVHRDVKPSNILLTRAPGTGRWHAELADLGIARLLDAESTTESGIVLGTAAYLAPEQVSGRRATTATDVYALGLVALEALTGARAFPGTAAESATARILRPPAMPGWVDGAWRDLLTAMTAMDPAARPDSAAVEMATSRALPPLLRRAAATAADATDDGRSTSRTEYPAEPTALLFAEEPAPAVATPRRRRFAVLLIAAAGIVAVGAVLAPRLTGSLAATPSASAAQPAAAPTVTVVATSAPGSPTPPPPAGSASRSAPAAASTRAGSNSSGNQGASSRGAGKAKHASNAKHTNGKGKSAASGTERSAGNGKSEMRSPAVAQPLPELPSSSLPMVVPWPIN